VGLRLIVDLDAQTVATTDRSWVSSFEIDEFSKYRLLNGLDDIALTLRHVDKIKAYEEKRKTQEPWLFAQ
jgi:3-isopropylmalate/(R)-2-methylmalate dehydratase small subunit